jgi:hypothetical protein
MKNPTNWLWMPNRRASCRGSLLVFIAASFLSGSILLAQSSNRGAIIGTVPDPSGAVGPGVTITITNVATVVVCSTGANEKGRYSVDFLVPGEYRFEAFIAGFKKSEISGLAVKVAEALQVDVLLEIG